MTCTYVGANKSDHTGLKFVCFSEFDKLQPKDLTTTSLSMNNQTPCTVSARYELASLVPHAQIMHASMSIDDLSLYMMLQQQAADTVQLLSMHPGVAADLESLESVCCHYYLYRSV